MPILHGKGSYSKRLDVTRRHLLRKGIRHDVQGSGHPIAKNGPGADDFELVRQLPVTVDEDTVRQHYQAKYEAGESDHDGEEMLRRYRFSVVISKLIEVLYRGYILDGSFARRVRAVNTISE